MTSKLDVPDLSPETIRRARKALHKAGETLEPKTTRYMPHGPTPKQAVFLSPPMTLVLEALFGGAAGGGKALAVDTPIPTPWGWTTMDELEVGDALFDERGVPCRVLAVTEIMRGRPCYEVSFSDGSRIVADAEHLWLTSTIASRQSAARADAWSPPGHPEFARPQTRILDDVVSTAEMALTTTIRGRTNHAVAVARPLVLPVAGLPVDPYLLGLWLGDGDSRRGYLTTGDPIILEDIERLGYEVEQQRQPLHYRIVGLTTELRELGVLGAKRIPGDYLRASAAQRLALLQGIVDTDGTVTSAGAVEITWTSEQLVDDLYELLTSLGIKVTVRESRATIDGRDVGPRWRLKWCSELPCARLPRKAKCQKRAGFRGVHARRYVVGVRRVASVPVRCIAVDSPSRLYLAGTAMIPTHNSDALLMAALQYVDVPGYAALLLRRTYKQLSFEGALMHRAEKWLRGTDARWNQQDHRWTFPSGASLSFGHIENSGDEEQYASAEFQFIGFDELTSFSERMYTFLFSRLRRLAGAPIPLRMRGASNPNGEGRDWVHLRFIAAPVDKDGERRIFIPARMEDNPHLDAVAYERALSQLGSIDYRQLRYGDWDVKPEGVVFKRAWFTPEAAHELPQAKRVRYWDTAATEVTTKGMAAKRQNDPDYTVGLRLAKAGDRYYVEDVQRFRATPGQVQARIAAVAEADGKGVPIRMEEEGGSAGKNMIYTYRSDVLDGYDFRGIRSTGSKEQRASLVAARAEHGEVIVWSAPWTEIFLDEITAFPEGLHDDQVDALSGAFGALAGRSTVRPRMVAPRGDTSPSYWKSS